MKKAVVFAASVFFFAAAGTARAQEPSDSLIRDNITEAVVSSALTPPNAPFAVSRIGKEELEEFSGSVKELPYLFARTPGVVAWGDNGLGTGTTYLRIRGSGDSRINVTLDGVPLNSPEDQCVFWANMNSYSSFLEGVRIQRGVGSSSNGDGAFGGTVALTLRRPSAERMLQTDFSYGSYNSARAGFSFSSGLIGGKWTAEAAFHHSHTDGYVHGTRGNSGSWIASVYYFASPKLTIKYRNIGNYERTGQAWNGVETGDRFYGNYGLDSGVRGYEDLLSEGLGLYNGLCESWSPRISGGYSFNPYPQITTDNFVQDHNLLGADYDAGAGWKLQGTLHYTYGYGYYSNFQKDKKLSKYGFSPFTGSDGAEVSKSDFVRKKGISQNAVGLVVNARKSWEKVDLYLGSSSQGFFADHFGYLTYIGNDDLKREYTPSGKPYRYYDSDAAKTDLSVFAKASWKLGLGFSLFGDLQYRFVHYRTGGVNDSFVKNANGLYENQRLDIDKCYNFVNPKGGLEWRRGRHAAFASVALSHREPERNNFTDNGSYPAPKPEKLLDYELGYSYESPFISGGITLYYMDYYDQFVQTGALSDIGEALTTNIARSFRSGLEISAEANPVSWLSLEADAAISTNRILDFDEVVEDWDSADGYRTIHYDSSVLAFSPSVVAGGGFRLHWKGAAMQWRTSYVSRQYLDNTACIDRSIPGYSNTDIDLSYSMAPVKGFVKKARAGLLLGNIFNSRHATSGWVYSAICESMGNPNDRRYTEAGYIPSAGFTIMASISLTF